MLIFLLFFIQIYVKSKVNCLLLSKDLSTLLRQMKNTDTIDIAAKDRTIKEELVEENDSDTEIWDKMPEVTEVSRPKKRHAELIEVRPEEKVKLSEALNKPVIKTKKSRLSTSAATPEVWRLSLINIM